MTGLQRLATGRPTPGRQRWQRRRSPWSCSTCASPTWWRHCDVARRSGGLGPHQALLAGRADHLLGGHGDPRMGGSPTTATTRGRRLGGALSHSRASSIYGGTRRSSATSWVSASSACRAERRRSGRLSAWPPRRWAQQLAGHERGRVRGEIEHAVGDVGGLAQRAAVRTSPSARAPWPSSPRRRCRRAHVVASRHVGRHEAGRRRSPAPLLAHLNGMVLVSCQTAALVIA